MTRSFSAVLAMVLAGIMLAGCQTGPVSISPQPAPAGIKTRKMSWHDVPGWPEPHAEAALDPLRKSCDVLMRKPPSAMLGPNDIGGRIADWRPVCTALEAIPDDAGASTAQAFFETWMTPVQILSADDNPDGLFTGYYEPLLYGSWQRDARYQVPLLKRPDDLVTVDLGQFRPEWKQQKITGRVENHTVVPYPDRAQIADGQIDVTRNSLLWVDDPIDAFFLEIQGSGQVELPDGQRIRVGYDAQNGHPYVPIGKVLMQMGSLPQGGVSMQSIRDWLQRHPDRQQEIFSYNPSVVFFRIIDGPGPLGAQGVPLTPGRSLAVDRNLLPYGVPVWLVAEDPDQPGQTLERMMIAQDTGGAIKGAVRGDVFWGFGPDAARRAGVMKSKGQMWVLVPVTSKGF